MKRSNNISLASKSVEGELASPLQGGNIIMREAVIVAGARTPIGRAKKGTLANTRPDDFGAVVVKETLKRAGYEGPIDDLIMGCAMPEAEQGMNVARLVGALAGLPDETPALTVNRFCSSGLQTIAYAARQLTALGAKEEKRKNVLPPNNEGE